LQHSYPLPYLHSFPTRRSSDLLDSSIIEGNICRYSFHLAGASFLTFKLSCANVSDDCVPSTKAKMAITLRQCIGYPVCAMRLKRSEEHTSELQSQSNLVCRLLL